MRFGREPATAALMILLLAELAAAQGPSSAGQADTASLLRPAPGLASTRDNASFDRQSASESVSTRKAISPRDAGLRSLLLPGWGQRAAGSARGFRLFLASEVSLWTAYAAFHAVAQWKEDAYRLFACEHAGIDPRGKDEQFYVNIENYDNLDEYNQAKLRQRNLRDYYRDRDKYAWQWDSPENRKRYERMRVESDRYANRAELTIGGILANHLLSAVHAVWAARKHALPSCAARRDWDWSLRLFPGPELSLRLQL
jgi:hypothetical protein